MRTPPRIGAGIFLGLLPGVAFATAPDFERDVRPLLAKHCGACHGAEKQESGYRLDVKSVAFAGGDSGLPAIVPGKPDESPLWKFVSTSDPGLRMPPAAGGVPALNAAERDLLKEWIAAGAEWNTVPATPTHPGPTDTAAAKTWWSFRPLVAPAVPAEPASLGPIDRYLLQAAKKVGLEPAPPADRRTLVRRVTFDLTGLPPTLEEIHAFEHDPDPAAFERLVDRLLASPHYGERQARHWLDVVHFGETHGYDKDQPRPNAWPYRDYVIRAFDADKSYARFVQEQIAGDVLFPGTRDGVEALGFLAAGPWDLIGHAEVPETKIDGKIARHLDRDDVVANVMSTFASLTVHCAQCHRHKFDPIGQDDYYGLQAVFAALDRADKEYDLDPRVAAERRRVTGALAEATAVRDGLRKEMQAALGPRHIECEKEIAALEKASAGPRPAEYGWHSSIAPTAEFTTWVQVDLGKAVNIDRIVLAPTWDDFNGIGPGFGFPRRYRIEASDDPTFPPAAVTRIAARDGEDQPNPGIAPLTFAAGGTSARYVRVTAVKPAPRKNDFMVALAELEAFDAAGKNLALGAAVTAEGSIEAAPRWRRANLTDGIYPAAGDRAARLETLRRTRDELRSHAGTPELRARLAAAEKAYDAHRDDLAKLPPPSKVYAGTIHHGRGSFAGTGANGGKPRPIHILLRGNVQRPGKLAEPGEIAALDDVIGLPGRFESKDPQDEGARRAALAERLTSPRHPLVWRSIVNRVWQQHFGRGLVETPNDFGRMGAVPDHPELLDHLAVEFRDGGGSLKALHRRIVLSEAYRRSADPLPAAAAQDAENRYFTRQKRRKLEAEAVRDAILVAADRLDRTLGGPSFRDFSIEHPQHSPHYRYDLHDPDDPAARRRSIYRFTVRSKPQPWMAVLDCADPSMSVERRNESVSPLQSLALLNNPWVLAMAKHFAARLERERPSLATRVDRAFEIALQRSPTPAEHRLLLDHAAKHGLPSLCRRIFNLNEFVFAD